MKDDIISQMNEEYKFIDPFNILQSIEKKIEYNVKFIISGKNKNKPREHSSDATYP